jgi:hypothetical protein
MYQIPTGFGPIPDPVGLSAAFVTDLSFGFAAWLGVAAVVYLALLPVALRRSRPERSETVLANLELPEAA